MAGELSGAGSCWNGVSAGIEYGFDDAATWAHGASVAVSENVENVSTGWECDL